MTQISIEPPKPMRRHNCTSVEVLIHTILTPTLQQTPVLNEYLKQLLDNAPRNKTVISVEII